MDRRPTLDRTFQALSHPVRREILTRLAHGPATVGDTTRGTATSKSAVTKHLKVLEDAGLINRTIRGRSHVLALQTEHLDDAADWIGVHRSLWERKLDVIAAALDGDA